MAFQKQLRDLGFGFLNGITSPIRGVGAGIGNAVTGTYDNYLARKNARIDNQLQQTIGNRAQRDPSYAGNASQLIQDINSKGQRFRQRLGQGTNKKALSAAGSGVSTLLQAAGGNAALQAPKTVLPQMVGTGIGSGTLNAGMAALRKQNIPQAFGYGFSKAPELIGASRAIEIIPNKPNTPTPPIRTATKTASSNFNPTQNLPWRELTGPGGFARLTRPRLFSGTIRR